MNEFRSIKFSVDPELAKKGLTIKFAVFSVTQIPRRRGSQLEKHILDIAKSLDVDKLLRSPIIREYKRLQKASGVKDAISPSEHLLKLIKKSGRLPNINRVVDAYNIVSAQTLLSMGAHDLSNIKGNLRLGVTSGTEKYTPLFSDKLKTIRPNEYAAMDEEKVICRLDLKQCDQTKITEKTKQFLIYVQGNKETNYEYVLDGLMKVSRNLAQFCNATHQIL